MSDQSFDVIIIGAGPGGYVAAIRAAQLGLKTACIDKRKELGGTCLNVGCIPSKALLDSSEHYAHTLKHLSLHGVDVKNPTLNLSQMMKRKDDIVKQLTGGVEYLFKKNKIQSFHGVGQITSNSDGQSTVEVDQDGEKTTLQGKHVIIATGSDVVELPFLPYNGKTVVSSTEALSLPEVPEHLVVVGGGVIGLELGSVWLRLGAKVTVVEFQDRLVPMMDHEMSAEMLKSLKKQGMEFKLGTKCLGAKENSSGLDVEIEEIKSGNKETLSASVVLVSTGRRPYTDGLGLEDVGVKRDKQNRVIVDERFQTNVQGIYAIGDVIAGPMLAHKAEEDGIAAVELIAGQAGHVNYNTIPSVVYTWPELASVGLSEEEVKENGTPYKVGKFPFMANGRAKAMNESEGLVKIIAHKETDLVLGVHIFGARASDMIPEAVSVMEFGGSAEDIARTCHAHPTLAEIVKEAALDVDGRKIHL